MASDDDLDAFFDEVDEVEQEVKQQEEQKVSQTVDVHINSSHNEDNPLQKSPQLQLQPQHHDEDPEPSAKRAKMTSTIIDPDQIESNWTTHKAVDGLNYYYNKITEMSTYVRPACVSDPAATQNNTTNGFDLNPISQQQQPQQQQQQQQMISSSSSSAIHNNSSSTGRGTLVVSKKAVTSSEATATTQLSRPIIHHITVPEPPKIHHITIPDHQQHHQQNHYSLAPPPPPLPLKPPLPPGGNGNTTYQNNNSSIHNDENNNNKINKHTLRTAAGRSWNDETLNAFPENDFRLFVGNLPKDLNDNALADTFSSKYTSFAMARVIYDKNNVSKGYGFVSLLDPRDCARAIREMDQSWLGSRPIKVRRSEWKDRDMKQVRKTKRKNKKKHLW